MCGLLFLKLLTTLITKWGAVKMLIDTKAQRNILSLGSFKTMNKANPNIKLKQTNAVIRSIDKTYIVVEVKK